MAFCQNIAARRFGSSEPKGEVDALRAASKTFADKLATFEAKFPDAHLGAVVAFGNNTWRALSGGVGAEELKDFPGYGKGLAPTTQFDVLIHILSLRHDVNFSVAQMAMEAFGDCIEVKEEIHGFRWVEERDLSGFVDQRKTRRVKRRVAKWRLSKTAWMRAAAMCLSSVGSTT